MRKNIIKDIVIIFLLLSGTAFLYFGFLKKSEKIPAPPRQRIGVVLPFSGKNKDIGNAIARSSMKATFEVNRFGGISDIPLQVEARESWCVGAYARPAGAFYMQNKGVEWLITGFCPEETASLADLSFDYETIMFVFHPMSALYELDRKEKVDPVETNYILSLSEPEINITDKLSQYWQDEGLTNMVVLTDLGTRGYYSRYWKQKFEKTLNQDEILSEINFMEMKVTDDGISKTIKEEGIDGILLISEQKDRFIDLIDIININNDIEIYAFDSLTDESILKEKSVTNIVINRGITNMPKDQWHNVINNYDFTYSDDVLRTYVITNLIADFMKQDLYGQAVIDILKGSGVEVNKNYIQFDENGDLIWEVVIWERGQDELDGSVSINEVVL